MLKNIHPQWPSSLTGLNIRGMHWATLFIDSPPTAHVVPITKGRRGYLSVLAFWSNDMAPAADWFYGYGCLLLFQLILKALSRIACPPFCQPHFPLSKSVSSPLLSSFPFRSWIPKLTEIEIYMCIQDKKVPRSQDRVVQLRAFLGY